MESSHSYSRSKGEQEHILTLPNNRQLAYADNGPPTSRILVLFFSGLFSIGTAPSVPLPCREIGARWIAPTLPGMGNSSTRAMSVPYNVSLARDISALLEHLYPTGEFDELYVAGGSYGTVQAQMLYGAPYGLFPAGRKIVGGLLLSGFSPVRCHKGYSKSLNWSNWLSFGPLTQILPFHPFQWLFRSAVGAKMKGVEGAKAFLSQTLFDKMDDEEKAAFQGWLDKEGITKDDFISRMARGTITSCRNWDGFMEVADVIHSDWGFEPSKLDDEHASKPVLVVGSSHDEIGGRTNNWMVKNYREAKLMVVPGGHISSLFYMDDIWTELLNMSICSVAWPPNCRSLFKRNDVVDRHNVRP